MPRAFFEIGTANELVLTDHTGDRRYLPVEVGVDGPIDVEGIVRDRDQLWAEAAEREGALKDGVRVDPALYEAQRKRVEEHEADIPFHDGLALKLTCALRGMREGTPFWILTDDAARLAGIPDGKRTPSEANAIGIALRDLGGVRLKRPIDGDKVWGFAFGWKEGEGPPKCVVRIGHKDEKDLTWVVHVPGPF